MVNSTSQFLKNASNDCAVTINRHRAIHYTKECKQQLQSTKGGGYTYSLVPRPSLAAFFAAVEKCAFFLGCKKSCEGRPGYEARIYPQLGGLLSCVPNVLP